MDAPDGTRGNCYNLTYVELHQLRRNRGRARKDSRVALRTRLSTTSAMNCERPRDAGDAMDTLDESPAVREERSRVDDLHLAFFV